MIKDKEAQTNRPLISEIKNRWSPRAFGPRQVEEGKLLNILEAARWAPSSNNEQPWRFIIARKGETHYDKLFEGLNEYNRKWAWTAPVLGATLAKKSFSRKDRNNKHYMHDIGLAMGNLLAQATHEGLSVHQMAGIVPENIISNFEVNKNEYEVVTMFVVGYQDESILEKLDERYQSSELKPRSRIELTDFVFGAKFGINPDWLT